MVSLNGKLSMVTEQQSADQHRRLLAEIPMGRFCEPAESSTSMPACTWIEPPRG